MTGPRLSIIPARAATDRALKPRDLQVLCVLGRHTDDLGWCRKSQVKMADEMGCARATVFEAIERLVKAGYLERYVQEEQNGRDSPHVYRVILDPKHADPGSVREADSDADDPCRQAGTPAGISAPPAGPEPAPPAGPEPAPKNDPLRTTHQNESEKERTREEEKAIERWLKKAHPNWPSYISDSGPKALAEARKLTEAEREVAADRMGDYVASAKVGGRTVICTFAVYLAEKRWEKLPPKAAPAVEADDYAPPFGPVWMAFVLGHMLDGPTNPDATAFAERWPYLFKLFGLARAGRGYRFGERCHALKGQMVAVPVDMPLWNDWKACFQQRGWPWLPDPGRVAYFPVGGPDGLEAFEKAWRGKQDDGDRHQAAE
ncbi:MULTISPECIES: helix-turn-helix domain-containing protein [unclassified Mesorhizobium]|uniref:helix-turn-helix domain-containing protein n=1 Tax=unclassified Mesorhizobium TaxID=325217 RepID=UPI000F75363B|nr:MULTISPECIES: helix-turn-helix domain-containing protein [unclassified Mesorhizobium]AZO04573.1 helix-turn-helix domain-containing protein [Mesorhizobium sp. M2A.F.Ca.ET.043.02.1.1]RUW72979.1 helix-turn-helix domain-containing protein [Mesorhizobium sp. M2A.F.Ca.ET.067.02.1.1]TIU57146.1 MAG: helix-turn-helix domain-containing protein [Mesorhizobium sp.]